MTPLQRLVRMRRTFAVNRSVLAEDYEYFTTRRAPIPQSKAAHRLGEQSGRRSREQSERPSSDNTGD